MLYNVVIFNFKIKLLERDFKLISNGASLRNHSQKCVTWPDNLLN